MQMFAINYYVFNIKMPLNRVKTNTILNYFYWSAVLTLLVVHVVQLLYAHGGEFG